MGTKDDFEVQAMSDPDYDNLIVEVLHKGEFLLRVSREDATGPMRVSIQPRRDGRALDLSVEELAGVLEKARNRLWELRRVPGVIPKSRP